MQCTRCPLLLCTRCPRSERVCHFPAACWAVFMVSIVQFQPRPFCLSAGGGGEPPHACPGGLPSRQTFFLINSPLPTKLRVCSRHFVLFSPSPSPLPACAGGRALWSPLCSRTSQQPSVRPQCTFFELCSSGRQAGARARAHVSAAQGLPLVVTLTPLPPLPNVAVACCASVPGACGTAYPPSSSRAVFQFIPCPPRQIHVCLHVSQSSRARV